MTGRDSNTGYTRQNFSVITSAHVGSSEEMSGRIRRYSITMGFRTACFVGMIFVPGVWRWILFACAVFLPYIAVVLANQAHQRGMTTRVEPAPAPEGSRQLTVGPEDVISGHVVEDFDPAPPRGRTDRRREPDEDPAR